MSALLDVDEAAARLRCSRRRVFELIADGTLVKGPKYGRRTVVTAASVALALEPAPERVPTVPESPKARTPRTFVAELAEVNERQRAAWRKPRRRSAA